MSAETSPLFPDLESPILITGPCSVESEEQIHRAAKEISEGQKIHALRGGIWKPRTRPNGFEGIGEQGLLWLKEAAESIGTVPITEVANAQHVEAALKLDYKHLWIGARTSANPFSVQEIADALKGSGITVLVKNPVNPDVKLWIGALERIQGAGIEKLGAVHRGFSVYRDSVYRNLPMWEIPISLMSEWPGLPIICDPSHIAGNREMLAFVSQKAYDLNMSGLMIESHPDPDAALSDPQQQLKPSKLTEMLVSLSIRKAHSDDFEFDNKLEELRNIIDDIDGEIIRKFAHRMSVIEKIGEYKKENDVTILQLDRWKEILKSRSKLGNDLLLDEQFVHQFLELLHQFSIQKQTEIMNEKKAQKKS
ncbi:bifunctional 3-deoxy-7-phosphoheptulonate synthase/chorismate mutase type II [Salibacteraceae bacterium]|jgi:chorismate mutase|nr:bifunctional 3-deoxy-7-phosphoheptulonate synthase/chorismate mutase type II [Salibacteraceae bacterium]